MLTGFGDVAGGVAAAGVRRVARRPGGAPRRVAVAAGVTTGGPALDGVSPSGADPGAEAAFSVDATAGPHSAAGSDAEAERNRVAVVPSEDMDPRIPRRRRKNAFPVRGTQPQPHGRRQPRRGRGAGERRRPEKNARDDAVARFLAFLGRQVPRELAHAQEHVARTTAMAKGLVSHPLEADAPCAAASATPPANPSGAAPPSARAAAAPAPSPRPAGEDDEADETTSRRNEQWGAAEPRRKRSIRRFVVSSFSRKKTCIVPRSSAYCRVG